MVVLQALFIHVMERDIGEDTEKYRFDSLVLCNGQMALRTRMARDSTMKEDLKKLWVIPMGVGNLEYSDLNLMTNYWNKNLNCLTFSRHLLQVPLYCV